MASSLKEDFEELRTRIKAGREFSSASFEPVFYLVFGPEQILTVKRELKAWVPKLKQDGWDVDTFSMADAIDDILKNHPLRSVWLKQEQAAPHDWAKINKSLANALTSGRALQSRLEAKLDELESHERGLLLVTDLEALHPYLRIGATENQLQGQFKSTTVFFYPGTRTGKTGLKFLGFYPDDGNYRSVHVGG